MRRKNQSPAWPSSQMATPRRWQVSLTCRFADIGPAVAGGQPFALLAGLHFDAADHL
jgi:hypothetical protein